MAQLSLVGAHDGGVTLACRLTPSGRIDVRLGTSDYGPLVPSKTSGRITDAFGLGRGHGVLHLAAAELGTELPPSLGFWRDLGQAFVGRVCGLLDPTDPKSLVIPDPDPGELESLIQTVPPMQGASTTNPRCSSPCARSMRPKWWRPPSINR